MIFNNYWWECEDDEQERELDRQLKFRAACLAAAVKTFFPDVDESCILRKILRGCDEE